MPRGVRFVDDTPESADDPVAELKSQFRERLERGQYDGLLDPSLRAVLREGAAIRGVNEELGAIRFALAKLLTEEGDAGKLAAGVARLTTAAVQAMRMSQTLADETDQSLADLLNEILIEMEEESRVARAARAKGGDDGAGWPDFDAAGP